MSDQTKKGISEMSADSLRPLINERNNEVKEKAIVSVEKLLDLPKDSDTGRFKKQIAGKEVVKLLAEARQEIKGDIELPLLEKGKYRTIVIDPPWEIEKIQRDVRPNQTEMDYPFVQTEEGVKQWTLIAVTLSH